MFSDQAVEIIKKNGKKLTADQLMTIGRQVDNTGRVRYFRYVSGLRGLVGIGSPIDDSGGECEVWPPIVKTGKLSADQLMEAGQKAHDSDVWQEIVSQGKLSAEQLMQAGKLAGDFDIWKQVIATRKLSVEQLLEVGKYDTHKDPWFGDGVHGRPNPWRLWFEIIDTGMLSVEQLMDIGRQLKNNSTWRYIIKTGKLSADQLMEAGQAIINTSDNKHQMYLNPQTEDERLQSLKDIWIWIVRTGQFSYEQLKLVSKLAKACGIHGDDIRWAVARQIDWKALTTNEQLIEVGLAIECWTVWSGIADKLDLTGLSEEQILEIGFKADNSIVWNKIKNKISWKEKAGDELMKLGRRARCGDIWVKIMETGTLTAEQLIFVGNRVNDNNFWFRIVERMKTFPQAQLVQAAKQCDNRDFWHWLIASKRIKLSDLSVDELLKLGSVMNSDRYWQMINEAMSKKKK